MERALGYDVLRQISVQEGGTVMGDKSPKNKEKKKPKKDKKAAASAPAKK